MSVKFKLRPWSMKDLPNLIKYANNFNIANNMMDGFPHPYTEESGKHFLEMVEKGRDLILCIEINGEAAGSVGIHRKKDIHRKNAEIGYWLAEPYWGKGIITTIVPEIVGKAFLEFDIERIYAPVFGRNKPSQRVLQKCGFNVEAEFKDTVFKNEKFEDWVILALRRTEWEKR